MFMPKKYREENDTMGTMRVPDNAYYGPQTARAAENFPISGLTLPKDFIRSLALLKKCAARVNRELGLLEEEISQTISLAAQEVMDGKHDDQFIVDVFQTGSGTSTNMNMNEVIASRGNEVLNGNKGGKFPIHPNDHVNLGQSSNDIIPTTIHLATLFSMERRLIPALDSLYGELTKKASEFAAVKKIGRTHLQDAVPMRLGNEFSGYARQIQQGIRRLQSVQDGLRELALGGTAVGSGINTHPEFARQVIELVSEHTGISFKEAENHFEAQAAQDTAVETSGALKTVAVSLVKIANDIRCFHFNPGHRSCRERSTR